MLFGGVWAYIMANYVGAGIAGGLSFAHLDRKLRQGTGLSLKDLVVAGAASMMFMVWLTGHIKTTFILFLVILGLHFGAEKIIIGG